MSAPEPTIERLTHNKVTLALHHLRSGHLHSGHEAAGSDEPTPAARPLLLLHGLGERSPRSVPAAADGWPGPVAALDFTGHGASTVPRGGGYSAEILLADADAAIAALDHDGSGVTVLGRGLGAYVALQLAGARPTQVRGAVLADGPGLAGGPTELTSQGVVHLRPSDRAPDPYVLLELGRDLRPPDYATSFVRLAVAGSPLDEPINVAAVYRPAWLAAVCDQQGVATAPVTAALAAYAGAG